MYLPYEPLSKKGDESTYVPEELSIAQKKAIKTIPKKITNIWDDWVCEQLQLTKEELFSLRMQKATGMIEKPSRINDLRKEVARIKTILNERREG